MSSDKI